MMPIGLEKYLSRGYLLADMMIGEVRATFGTTMADIVQSRPCCRVNLADVAHFMKRLQ